MALDVGAVLVRRALELGVQGVDQRVEPRRLAVRHDDRAPALAGQQPLRRAAARSRVDEPLLAEAHDGTVEILAELEHVDLAAPDHGDRVRPHGERAAVEQVPAAARADPDQLVVVVAVRLTHGLAAEARPVERQDLHRATVESVDGDAGCHVELQILRRCLWRPAQRDCTRADGGGHAQRAHVS